MLTIKRARMAAASAGLVAIVGFTACGESRYSCGDNERDCSTLDHGCGTAQCVKGVCEIDFVNDDQRCSLTNTSGGSGGGPYLETCPDGQILIGVEASEASGYWNGALSHLQGLCGELVASEDGVAVEERAPLVPRSVIGTYGPVYKDSPKRVACGPDEVLVGVDGAVDTLEGTAALSLLAINCAALVVDDTGDFTFGDTVRRAGSIGSSISEPTENLCTGGQIARGFSGRFGAILDSFGVVCRDVP